jgi:hypothetical protein
MYCTVTEVVNGVAQVPSIFSDNLKAEKHFDDCVKENDADVIYADEFCKVARIADDGTIALHYQVPHA